MPPLPVGARLLSSLTAASAPAIRVAGAGPAPGPDPSPARGRPFAALLVRRTGWWRAPSAMLGGDPPVTRAGSAAGRESPGGRWPGPSSVPAGTPAPCLSALVMNGIRAVYRADNDDAALPAAMTAAPPAPPCACPARAPPLIKLASPIAAETLTVPCPMHKRRLPAAAPCWCW